MSNGDDLTLDRIRGSVPVPDPTKLTTDAVNAARDQWRLDLAALREAIDTRFDAMDAATTLRLEQLNRIPLTIREEIAHLRELHDRDVAGMAVQIGALRELLLARMATVSDVVEHRFLAVDTRFDERDQRTTQAAEQSKISLDAALAAAKEAVSEQNKANAQAITKSEIAIQKQIDSLGAVMSTSIKSLEDKISEASRRLDRGEGHSAGMSDGWKFVVALVGMVAAAATVAAAILAIRGPL